MTAHAHWSHSHLVGGERGFVHAVALLELLDEQLVDLDARVRVPSCGTGKTTRELKALCSVRQGDAIKDKHLNNHENTSGSVCPLEIVKVSHRQ